ncbi:hypothetical protein [Streptococcus suis]|nr:hypothetical protein [Streptococcus suis]MDY7596236.1 hypothetical protein [Streptococcus suis]
MKLSELADILTASGIFLVGLASIITAIKKKPSEPHKDNKE